MSTYHKSDDQPIPEEEAQTLMDAAGRRYFNDAEFSARVKLAVSVADAGQPNDDFDRWNRGSLIAGAAVALHLADLRPAVGQVGAGDIEAAAGARVTADQPAEGGEQARWWLGTVTAGDIHYFEPAPLYGPNVDGEYLLIDTDAGESLVLAEDEVSDLRPAVVVPQREDDREVEVDRLAIEAHRAYRRMKDAPLDLRWQHIVRAVLAAQRPATPVGDEPWVIYEAREGIIWTVNPPTQANAEREAAGFMDGEDEVALGPHIAMPKALADQLANAWRTGRHAGIDHHTAALPAAPVAVDEATVARALGEHFGDWLDDVSAVVGCACGVICPAGFASHRTHLATELVRALAARDEDGGAS